MIHFTTDAVTAPRCPELLEDFYISGVLPRLACCVHVARACVYVWSMNDWCVVRCLWHDCCQLSVPHRLFCSG